MKIIIIGGVAAGAKVAAKTRRTLPDSEIHIYTKDNFVSYSSCGMPYYIGGDFQDWHKLLIRSVEEFERSGIHIHTRQLVTKILPADKKIAVQNIDTQETYFVEYDKLVISTGAEANIPDFIHPDLKNIFKLRSLDDGIKIREVMEKSKHITIVGGGFIAIELLDAFVKNNKNVTLIERSPYILSKFDEDISKIVQEYILENSDNLIKIINNDTLSEVIGTDTVKSVITAKGSGFETDMVVLCSGVKPNVKLAQEAGIAIGITGAIKVNSRMETNIPDIFACGDCAEKINMITAQPDWLPLGSTANKEGRVTAINLSGGVEDFEGVLGSAVLKYKMLNISTTGLTEHEAFKLGYDAISVIISKRDKAGYMPEEKNVTLKLIADKRSHKLLGAQAVGTGDADKRVNTVTTGLIENITVENLVDIDLTYAPPFSTSIDILISAARILKTKLNKTN